MTLAGWGEGPVEVEGIPCRLEVPFPAKDVVVYVLDSIGNRMARLRVTTAGERATFDIGPEDKSLWYELIVGKDAAYGYGPYSRSVPVVLDVNSGTGHYTTELSLTNRNSVAVLASLRYQASLGKMLGSGEVSQPLTPGQQLIIPNVIEYLRDKGLSIPSSTEDPAQGGVLAVRFEGSASEGAVAVAARTATTTVSPQPVGTAGLSYSGILPSSSTSTATLYGLRQNSNDRSNVAVFSVTPDPVTVRVTAHDGAGTGRTVLIRESEQIPPFGWTQFNRILEGTGIPQGWVTIEQTGGTGMFGAYGVINDNVTSDGSFVPPVLGVVAGQTITVPVVVESPSFRSELVLANRSSAAVTLTMSYTESLSPGRGEGGTFPLQLGPKEQRIIPDAVDFLRRSGIQIGPLDAATYAGALRIRVDGASLSEIFACARTAAQSKAGGQFGLFTPGVFSKEYGESGAFLYGLRSDERRRTNVALLNAEDAAGSVTLEIWIFDGDRSGAPTGSPETVTLRPGQWHQINDPLKPKGVRNGWAHVARVSGAARWIAYAVVNDGANPGERTGDGAFVEMIPE